MIVIIKHYKKILDYFFFHSLRPFCQSIDHGSHEYFSYVYNFIASACLLRQVLTDRYLLKYVTALEWLKRGKGCVPSFWDCIPVIAIMLQVAMVSFFEVYILFLVINS